MALTRTFGASSADKARVNPSTAPFALAMTAWLLKPCCTATVENKTTAPLFFFSPASTLLMPSAAATNLPRLQTPLAPTRLQTPVSTSRGDSSARLSRPITAPISPHSRHLRQPWGPSLPQPPLKESWARTRPDLPRTPQPFSQIRTKPVEQWADTSLLGPSTPRDGTRRRPSKPATRHVQFLSWPGHAGFHVRQRPFYRPPLACRAEARGELPLSARLLTSGAARPTFPTFARSALSSR